MEEGQGVGRFGQGKGQGQLKLKKKCRYKVINCQACRNPNLLETKNFHFFAFSALSLSHVGSVEFSLAQQPCGTGIDALLFLLLLQHL